MDVFVEQLVKKNKTVRDTIIKVILIALIVIVPATLLVLSVYITYLAFLAPLSLPIMIYIAWYFITGLNLEYEYAVTNGDITIDKIIAKRKRKRMVSIDIKRIEDMGKINNKDFDKRPSEYVYYASQTAYGDDVYGAAFFSEEKGSSVLLFSPNEKVLNAMRPFLKPNIVREVFLKK